MQDVRFVLQRARGLFSSAARLTKELRFPIVVMPLMSVPSPVRNNPAQHRFEMDTQAGVAVANYRRDGLVYRVHHTEVPRALEGRGLGTQLVKGMLDMIRAEGSRVVPACGFVRRYFALHPQDHDLLA